MAHAAARAAPTACRPFTLARRCPPRRDQQSTMRASAGALARLTAGALSNPVARASAAATWTLMTPPPAVAVFRPRPPSSSRRGNGHRGFFSSPKLGTPATAAATSSRGAAEVENAQGGDRRSSGGDPRGRAPRPPSASYPASPASSVSFVAASERGTAALAALLSSRRQPGDVLLLYGDVGAGKSAFARAFIRAAARDRELPVPSPTFLLHNVYDAGVVADRGPDIHHFDLYRLGGAGGGRVSPGSRSGGGGGGGGGGPSAAAPSLSALDAERCGLAEALGIVPPTTTEGGAAGGGGDGGGGGGGPRGVSLVEWADRLGGGGGGGNGGGASSSDGASPPPSSSRAAGAAPPFLLPNDRVLEVAIEPLTAERALELSARHPRLLLASSAAEEEGQGRGGDGDGGGDEDGDGEIEFDEFADTRWRLITLRPRGPRAREAAEEAARALRELDAGSGERVAIEEEKEGDRER